MRYGAMRGREGRSATEKQLHNNLREKKKQRMKIRDCHDLRGDSEAELHSQRIRVPHPDERRKDPREKEKRKRTRDEGEAGSPSKAIGGEQMRSRRENQRRTISDGWTKEFVLANGISSPKLKREA